MRILSGEFKGRSLKTTIGPGYRPAMGKVRSALFSMLEARGVNWPETRVLDLFAGSGSLGFEALSRGAAQAVFVEAGAKAAALIAENANRFGLPPDRWQVHAVQARVFLSTRCAGPFDLIFIDPPYEGGFLSATLNAVLRGGWLAPDGLVNAEVERRLDIDAENGFPPLCCETDRTYGQTRVILWSL